MKKIYTLFLLSAFYISMSAQTTELWSGSRWGGYGLGEGIIFKTDGNGNCGQLAFAYDTIVNGYQSYGGLVAASNGMLYGTTSGGGFNGYGVLFELNPVTGVYTKKSEFDGIITGNFPLGNLVQAGNGKLYGLTNNGGTYNKGVLFEYDIALDTCIAVVQFDGPNNGAGPANFLSLGSNGKMYGSTWSGGLQNFGTIFEVDTNRVFTKLYDFDGVNNAKAPLAVIQASNGKLYGMANTVLTNGIIFSFNPANSQLSVLTQFTSTTGTGADGGLVEAPNGKLYGVCRYGGDSLIDGGTLFEFDTVSNTITHVVNGPAIGYNTYYMGGTLFLASNGKLYGSSDFDYYEYDYVNDIFVSKVSTDSIWSASEPRNMRFTETVRYNSEYVWPGDCNHDGVADNNDLLSIGLAYGDSGISRLCASNDWIAQQCDNWSDTLNGGVNMHHADANGDGYVNADDTLSILLNYGMLTQRPAAIQSGPVDFILVPDHTTLLPGDTVRYNILLSSGSPVDSLYGIAFRLSYDSSLALPAEEVSYTSSSLGNIGVNMISLEKDFYANGDIDAAVTRTDHTNATALTGSLGTLSMIVSAAVTAPNVSFVIASHDIVAVTASGQPLIVNSTSDTLYINAPSATSEPLVTSTLLLYPNPANDRLSVRLNNETIKSLELFDASGRRVIYTEPSSRITTINTTSLAGGIYSVTVKTVNNVYHQKVLLLHP